MLDDLSRHDIAMNQRQAMQRMISKDRKMRRLFLESEQRNRTGARGGNADQIRFAVSEHQAVTGNGRVGRELEVLAEAERPRDAIDKPDAIGADPGHMAAMPESSPKPAPRFSNDLAMRYDCRQHAAPSDQVRESRRSLGS